MTIDPYDDLTPPALGAVVEADRGSLPFALIHGEALVACAAWALGQAGVTPIDLGTTWAGIVESGTSHVRLLRREELRKLDEQKGLQTQRERGLLTTCEVLQRTIHALDKDGDVGAARVLAQVPEYRERVRDLAYRLHNICERKGWSGEALYYNMLVTSWDGANREARSLERIQHIQQQPLL